MTNPNVETGRVSLGRSDTEESELPMSYPPVFRPLMSRTFWQTKAEEVTHEKVPSARTVSRTVDKSLTKISSSTSRRYEKS